MVRAVTAGRGQGLHGDAFFFKLGGREEHENCCEAGQGPFYLL